MTLGDELLFGKKPKNANKKKPQKKLHNVRIVVKENYGQDCYGDSYAGSGTVYIGNNKFDFDDDGGGMYIDGFQEWLENKGYTEDEAYDIYEKVFERIEKALEPGKIKTIQMKL